MRAVVILPVILLSSCTGMNSPTSETETDWTAKLPPGAVASDLLDESCSYDPAPGRPHWQAGPSDAPDRDREVLLAWGLSPLSDHVANASRKEIRIWLDFGLVYPQLLLRLVGKPPQVDGELLGWWISPTADEDPMEPSMERFMAGLHCKGRVIRGSINVCRFCPGKNEDWLDLWSQLSNLGVWSLPSGSYGLTREIDGKLLVIADGSGVTVEVLSEGHYSKFEYWLWENEAAALGQKAESIFKLVSDLRPDLP